VRIVKAKSRIPAIRKKRSCDILVSPATEIIFLKKPSSVSCLGLKNLVKNVLAQEHIAGARISLILASDASLKSLNNKFHARNFVTDVLAFNLAFSGQLRKRLFGDIYVSVDRARIIAKRLKISFKEELCRYCIHGLLHLIGYDDLDPKSKKKMWERQEFLLKKIVQSV